MSSTNKGSALLIVVAVICVVTLLTVTISHQATWASQIVAQRTVYAKNYRALQSLLEYGIEFTKHNYAKLLEQKKEVILQFDSWLEDEKGLQFSGQIKISNNKENITVFAQLKNKEQLILSASATLEQIAKSKQIMVKNSIIIS